MPSYEDSDVLTNVRNELLEALLGDDPEFYAHNVWKADVRTWVDSLLHHWWDTRKRAIANKHKKLVAAEKVVQAAKEGERDHSSLWRHDLTFGQRWKR